MAQHQDDQQYWNRVAGGYETEQASDGGPCDLCSKTCSRCAAPIHQHTQAGLIECAWRGPACQTCEHPPHPDGAYGPCHMPGCAPEHSRCAHYTHPDDTRHAQQLRAVSPWHRDTQVSFYMWRHCNHRRQGQKQHEPVS